MITTVGKFTFVLLLFPFYLTAASINLKLTTLEGAPLEQAGAGTPFLLNVVVTNTTNSAQYPTLKGIDNLHVRQSGFQMNMVNSTTSVTYHYRVRIDTPGNYTLGPAQITEEGKVIESDSITITVADQQKSKGTRTQKASAPAPLMKLICDTTQAYVGQKINAELSFYTADPTTVLQTIIEPEMSATSGLAIKNKQTQPITGTEKINGTEFRFAKWNFQITPTKSGSLIIPAYAAQYTSQANSPMLSFFFHNDAKRVYSNTVALDVKPLPDSLRAPTFIGTINQMSAHINPTHARVGQGLVYSITLSGDGDFDSIGMLTLAMPEQCKWYESKKNYTPASGQFGTYTMEYIVQALEPGTITIPKQELFYFDTSLKQYKTLSTSPITITISGTGTLASESNQDLPTNVNVDASTIDPLAPLNLEGPIEHLPPRVIPWYIFWVFIGLMSALWLAIIVVTTGKNYLRQLLILIAHKQTSIYAFARKSVNHAYQKKQYSKYYEIINKLFASRLEITQAQLSPHIMENSLIQDGLSAQALEDWRNFYAELCQFSFYKANLDTPYYNELTQKMLYWIDVLEKLPRVRV